MAGRISRHASPSSVPRGNGRILVVDDEEIQVQTMTSMLERLGYKAIGKTDPRRALREFRRHPEAFDLVLTDQNMPKMDGLTLIKTLRGLPQYKSAPILMLTTESSDAMKAQGKAAGATGWLVKPFDPQKLLEVVKKVIG